MHNNKSGDIFSKAKYITMAYTCFHLDKLVGGFLGKNNLYIYISKTCKSIYLT